MRVNKGTSTIDVAQTTRRKIRAEAAAWIVRLHGPHRSPDLEAGFRAWLAESSENGIQFERVTETWEAAAGNPAPGIPRMARWNPAPPRHRWAIAAILVIAIGVAGTFALMRWSVTTYTTEIGEQRLVRLEDGSRVTLNSGTKISIAFTKSERRIRLKRGEAFFEVARNPNRPFIVAAGDRRVTALGTVFAVSYDSDRTAVTLVEGKISVDALRGAAPTVPALGALKPKMTPAGLPDTGAVILSPGERLTFTSRSAPKIDEPKLEAVTAWRHGEVVLDNTPLADAVAEMNRYESIRLVIEDPRTAALRVSGIYHTGDSDGFAQTVAQLYGLEIRQQPGQILLRAR
jgi:transmembrane sensor